MTVDDLLLKYRWGPASVRTPLPPARAARAVIRPSRIADELRRHVGPHGHAWIDDDDNQLWTVRDLRDRSVRGRARPRGRVESVKGSRASDRAKAVAAIERFANTQTNLVKLLQVGVLRDYPQGVKRIRAYLAKPSFEGWDDIYAINLGRTSVWRALIELDRTFATIALPRPGRRRSATRKWARFPDSITTARALRYAITALKP